MNFEYQFSRLHYSFFLFITFCKHYLQNHTVDRQKHFVRDLPIFSDMAPLIFKIALS